MSGYAPDDGINGGIIRVEHDRFHPYRTINTSFAQDGRLTWAARGVLVYLLSKPDGWQLRVGDLINQSAAGRDAVYAILRNLESCGYLERSRSRRTDGTFEHTTIVYEVARDVPDAPLPDYPETDEPYTDNPLADKPEVDDFRGVSPLLDKPEAVQPLAVNPDVKRIEMESTKEVNIKDAGAGGETGTCDDERNVQTTTAIVLSLRRAGFDLTQMSTIIQACGDTLTVEYLNQWHAILAAPPTGLRNPLGLMFSKLSQGDLALPVRDRPGADEKAAIDQARFEALAGRGLRCPTCSGTVMAEWEGHCPRCEPALFERVGGPA